MFRRFVHLLALLLATASVPSLGVPPSVPPVDAPALAALGPHAVGLRTLSVRQNAGAAERRLRTVLWYPAVAAPGARSASYRHRLEPPPPLPSVDSTTEALAIADARAASGSFPLVVISHGYRGWPESMSHLAENLASKGYVVAGIDHGDLPYADAVGFGRSFALTVLNRARDQQAVIAELRRLARAGDPTLRAADAGRLALVGYSMGGFGALATAGAGYDPASPALRALPPGSLLDQAEGRRAAEPGLRALVLIAPWGAQPPHRAWSPAGLARLRAPALFIAGDADDVSNYADGIRWLFDRTPGPERRLLLYHHARHNVGANPSPPEARGSFALREYFDEPVWRHDRLNAINQHFVTAFLDRHLKDERARGADLRPTTPGASPVGFQPRWALGFALLGPVRD